jgi:anthranilate synthase component 1
MISLSKRDFAKIAKIGTVVPIIDELVVDTETPLSAFAKIAIKKDGTMAPYSFLLESVEGGENIARYSFLAANPAPLLIYKSGKALLYGQNKAPREIIGKDIFEKVQNAVSEFKPIKMENLPPFSGGAVGYFSYDVLSEAEPTVIQPGKKPVDVPEALFMFTDTLLAFDRAKHIIQIIVNAKIDSTTSVSQIYDKALGKIARLKALLRHSAKGLPYADLSTLPREKKVHSNKSFADFKNIVEKIKRYIFDGDIIQAVISQRFSTSLNCSPLSLYRALRMLNPSPYMFFLNCGDFSLVGASPEVHVKCVDKMINVRPIAGTRRRGKNSAEDDALASELLADPKERAEHIMLVDLARNDLGRIAESGSVKVDELMSIEKYSHVMHIVSNVKGTLKKGLKADAVMRSTFPAGTLSGAPKVRAMQIISELENEKRGPYGGAVAYYSFNGNLNSCITIRTALIKDGKAFIQSGAGIVADSIPEKEYEETQNKAKAMIKAVAIAENMENKKNT